MIVNAIRSFLRNFLGIEEQSGPDDRVQGVFAGVVADTDDPSALARVRVRIPALGEDFLSPWAPVVVPMAGDDRGVQFMPEVDDQVVVAFERADPRLPYVLGSTWGAGGAQPPAESEDHRLVRTRSNSELAFRDGPSPSVSLSTGTGERLHLAEDGIVLQDDVGNTIEISSGDGTIRIRSTARVEIESADVKIKSSGAMEIGAAGTLTIQGAVVNIN